MVKLGLTFRADQIVIGWRDEEAFGRTTLIALDNQLVPHWSRVWIAGRRKHLVSFGFTRPRPNLYPICVLQYEKSVSYAVKNFLANCTRRTTLKVVGNPLTDVWRFSPLHQKSAAGFPP